MGPTQDVGSDEAGRQSQEGLNLDSGVGGAVLRRDTREQASQFPKLKANGPDPTVLGKQSCFDKIFAENQEKALQSHDALQKLNSAFSVPLDPLILLIIEYENGLTNLAQNRPNLIKHFQRQKGIIPISDPRETAEPPKKRRLKDLAATMMAQPGLARQAVYKIELEIKGLLMKMGDDPALQHCKIGGLQTLWHHTFEIKTSLQEVFMMGPKTFDLLESFLKGEDVVETMKYHVRCKDRISAHKYFKSE